MRNLSSLGVTLVLSAILAPGCSGEVETGLPAPGAPAPATSGPTPGPTPDADTDAGAAVPGADGATVDGAPVLDAHPSADLRPDAPSAMEGEGEDQGPPPGPAASSGCPPPARLTPADLPPGYLPPVPVGYLRTVDGDTAHFDHPDLGEIIVRFLYVNTEESHGDPGVITDFGLATEEVVRGYLRNARQRVVALRADPDAPGLPDRDVYDRLLGLVFVEGELFQTRLVREGLTPYYNKFGCAPEPIHSALIDAEAEANDQDRGIWSAGHPLDYRPILQGWIARYACRPDPFQGPYCP